MKLADIYSPGAHRIPDNGLYVYYQSFILDCLREPEDRDPSKETINYDKYQYELSESEKEFYKEYYVPQGKTLNVKDHVELRDIFNRNVRGRIGEHVKDMLNFINNPKNLGLLIAPIGCGKTVLLRYMWFYLIGESRELQEKFIPIYMSVDQNNNLFQGTKTRDQIRDIFLEKMLHERLVDAANSFTELDNESFWDYLKKGSDRFNTLEQYEDDLRKVYANNDSSLNSHIFAARMKARSSSDFYLVALKYIREKLDKVPVLLLDNIDTLSLEVNQTIFDEAIFLSKEYNLKILVSMRTTTYGRIVDKYDGSYHAHPPAIIEMGKPDVKNYIKSRIGGIKKKMRRSKPEFEYIDYDGSSRLTFRDGEEVIGAMVDTLITDESVSCLSHIAYYNLRKINSLIKGYLSSGYIDEHMLVKRILDSILNDERRDRGPLWILLSSIITDNHKTRFSDMGMAYQEAVFNLYSNGRSNPGEYLIRTHILNFAKRHKDTTLQEILDAYLTLSDHYSEKLMLSIKYTVWRFLSFDLFESPDHYKIPSYEYIDQVKTLHLTATGDYYRRELRNYFEYLVYMKDDVELLDNSYGIQDCIKVTDLAGRYKEVHKFLVMMYDVEKKLLFGFNRKRREFFANNFSNPSDLNPFVTASPVESLIEFGRPRADRLGDGVQLYESLSKEISDHAKIFNKPEMG